MVLAVTVLSLCKELLLLYADNSIIPHLAAMQTISLRGIQAASATGLQPAGRVLRGHIPMLKVNGSDRPNVFLPLISWVMCGSCAPGRARRRIV